MSELLTISPFEHGSYSYVLHAGLTDRPTRINLADPAVCGDFITVPPYTAFIAYRRMLAIAFADAGGWNAEDFEVFVGNRDFEIRCNTRNMHCRTITWVRGKHDGAEYVLSDHGTWDQVVTEVKNWGRQGPPATPEEEKRRREAFQQDAKCSHKVAIQCLEHRIFRHIPPGCLVRQRFKEVVKYDDKPDFDKAIQAMYFLNMMDIDDKTAWIRHRLRPISQASV